MGDEDSSVNATARIGHPPGNVEPGDRTSQRNALSALFQAEFTTIYAFVLARSGSSAIAEDIASETFADAARAVRQGKGNDLDRSWLFMVARRRLVDHWRSDERQRRRIERLRLRRSPEDTASVVQDEQVLAALASLPTRQRAALTLRYLDEYSVPEVAETLGVTYRAAESLLSRARAGFVKAFEQTDHPR